MFGRGRIFTFYMVVRSDGTPKDTPGQNTEDGVAHPLQVDVADESLQLVTIRPLVKLSKSW